MIILRRKKTRKLDFLGQNLVAFPNNVFDDKTITSLNLSDNHIKEIPARIGELKNLEYLYLDNNDISQLHNGILKAESLKGLFLRGNPMKSLPDFIKENAKFSIFTDKEVYRYYPEVVLSESSTRLQDEVGCEVDGIIGHDTIFEETPVVPTAADGDLTFPRHGDRKGKSLETCVLFVDIRDSVQKNNDHRTPTLAKMYSAFVYGVLRIAKEYNGHVRNIIGDRVMVVFDKENCCDNAVRCAWSILYFCKNKMGKTMPGDSFRCGIGIHYGTMNVIKVGLEIHSDESNDYKNLVWIGEPANLASRLTDMAGKENIPSITISKDVFKGLTNNSLKVGFRAIDKKKFKDVDFDVYGCNLLIK